VQNVTGDPGRIGADLVAVQTEWELKLRSIIANLSSPMETIY
jgi:hypothetical protein